MARFSERFRLTAQTRVLDVGGNDFNWRFVPVRPQLTFLNLTSEFFGNPEATDQLVIGDGCALPFPDKSFDVVFCNSVIEHLHTRDNQFRLAKEIERVGRNVFVQTPNFWFPVEPHFLGLGVQFIPRRFRPRYARLLTPWGWIQKPTREEARNLVDEIRLLSGKEFETLFSSADVEAERTFGLTKSWLAIRTPST